MLDIMFKAGGFLLERWLQVHVQNSVVDVPSAKNIYVSGVKREHIKNASTIQVNILRGWRSKVGKGEIVCQTELPVRFE